ncbi:phosphotransferase [Thalassotalea maritima]|uniref:phosphotransferase n=1 Tax=Thalassotalea maritima TaxID=3242416 RepID=UPI003528D3FC
MNAVDADIAAISTRIEDLIAQCNIGTMLHSVVILHGGLSKQTWKFTTERGVYVYQKGNEPWPLSDQLLHILYKNNITIEALYYNAEQAEAIFVHIDGKQLDQQGITRQQQINVLAQRLCRLHQIKLSASLKNITRLDHSSLSALLTNLLSKVDDEKLLRFLGYGRQQIKQLSERLIDALEIDEQRLCVNHGDANMANVIIADKDLHPWFIDLDCACLAEPEYDIAMCMAINALTDDERLAFARHYQAGIEPKDVKIEHEKVTRYLDICLLINALWYFPEFSRINQISQIKVALGHIDSAKSMLHRWSMR